MSNQCREIPGYARYMACANGYVVSKKTGYIHRGNKKKTGYYEVCLRDDEGKKRSVLIHRIIAEAFCAKTGEGLEVNHINGEKNDNRADNLEWVSHNENLKHAYESGAREDDVSAKRVVAENMETGEVKIFNSIYSAARQLGISQGNICMCCKGRRLYAGGYYWKYQGGNNDQNN